MISIALGVACPSLHVLISPSKILAKVKKITAAETNAHVVYAVISLGVRGCVLTSVMLLHHSLFLFQIPGVLYCRTVFSKSLSLDLHFSLALKMSSFGDFALLKSGLLSFEAGRSDSWRSCL